MNIKDPFPLTFEYFFCSCTFRFENFYLWIYWFYGYFICIQIRSLSVIIVLYEFEFLLFVSNCKGLNSFGFIVMVFCLSWLKLFLVEFWLVFCLIDANIWLGDAKLEIMSPNWCKNCQNDAKFDPNSSILFKIWSKLFKFKFTSKATSKYILKWIRSFHFYIFFII